MCFRKFGIRILEGGTQSLHEANEQLLGRKNVRFANSKAKISLIQPPQEGGWSSPGPEVWSCSGTFGAVFVALSVLSPYLVVIFCTWGYFWTRTIWRSPQPLGAALLSTKSNHHSFSSWIGEWWWLVPLDPVEASNFTWIFPIGNAPSRKRRFLQALKSE